MATRSRVEVRADREADRSRRNRGAGVHLRISPLGTGGGDRAERERAGDRCTERAAPRGGEGVVELALAMRATSCRRSFGPRRDRRLPRSTARPALRARASERSGAWRARADGAAPTGTGSSSPLMPARHAEASEGAVGGASAPPASWSAPAATSRAPARPGGRDRLDLVQPAGLAQRHQRRDRNC